MISNFARRLETPSLPTILRSVDVGTARSDWPHEQRGDVCFSAPRMPAYHRPTHDVLCGFTLWSHPRPVTPTPAPTRCPPAVGAGAAMADAALVAKIQSQARRLVEQQQQLLAALAYGQLCERRVLQLSPGHALPLTAEMLDEEVMPRQVPAPTLRVEAVEERIAELEFALTQMTQRAIRAEAECEALQLGLGMTTAASAAITTATATAAASTSTTAAAPPSRLPIPADERNASPASQALVLLKSKRAASASTAPYTRAEPAGAAAPAAAPVAAPSAGPPAARPPPVAASSSTPAPAAPAAPAASAAARHYASSTRASAARHAEAPRCARRVTCDCATRRRRCATR